MSELEIQQPTLLITSQRLVRMEGEKEEPLTPEGSLVSENQSSAWGGGNKWI